MHFCRLWLYLYSIALAYAHPPCLRYFACITQLKICSRECAWVPPLMCPRCEHWHINFLNFIFRTMAHTCFLPGLRSWLPAPLGSSGHLALWPTCRLAPSPGCGEPVGFYDVPLYPACCLPTATAGLGSLVAAKCATWPWFLVGLGKVLQACVFSWVRTSPGLLFRCWPWSQYGSYPLCH